MKRALTLLTLLLLCAAHGQAQELFFWAPGKAYSHPLLEEPDRLIILPSADSARVMVFEQVRKIRYVQVSPPGGRQYTIAAPTGQDAWDLIPFTLTSRWGELCPGLYHVRIYFYPTPSAPLLPLVMRITFLATPK